MVNNDSNLLYLKKIKVCAVCARKVLKHVRKARHSCGGSKWLVISVILLDWVEPLSKDLEDLDNLS